MVTVRDLPSDRVVARGSNQAGETWCDQILGHRQRPVKMATTPRPTALSSARGSVIGPSTQSSFYAHGAIATAGVQRQMAVDALLAGELSSCGCALPNATEIRFVKPALLIDWRPKRRRRSHPAQPNIITEKTTPSTDTTRARRTSKGNM